MNEYTEGTFQVEIKDADMQAMSEIADAISILTLWTRDSTSSFSYNTAEQYSPQELLKMIVQCFKEL
jgi:hypothetical protein